MKKILKRKIESYFDLAANSIEEKIFSSYISKEQYKYWQDSFLKTADTSRLMNQSDLLKIAKSTTMLRYYYITIENSREVFPIDEFINALQIELYDSEERYRIEDLIETAVSIVKNWQANVIKHKSIFKNVTLFNDLSLSKKNLDENYKNNLIDRVTFTQNYFQSYEDPLALNTIRIHYNLPTRRWLNWKEPYVDVKINLSDKVELGFIRIGYDYQLLGVREEDAFLKYATLSKEADREILYLSEKDIDNSDKVIWVH